MQQDWDMFRQTWLKHCAEIKKQSFDSDQCHRINTEFIDQFFLLYATFVFSQKKTPEYYQIYSELCIALEISFSNYRATRSKFWSRIFGGEKKLNLIENIKLQ